MNYKAELRGFALDRAIRLSEINNNLPDDIFAEADKIVNYLYIEEKDIKSHLETLLPLIVRANDLEKLEDLILQLQQIKAEMEAGITKPEMN